MKKPIWFVMKGDFEHFPWKATTGEVAHDCTAIEEAAEYCKRENG